MQERAELLGGTLTAAQTGCGFRVVLRVEATRRLRASHPEIKVVVLTTYADDRSVIEACGPVRSAT